MLLIRLFKLFSEITWRERKGWKEGEKDVVGKRLCFGERNIHLGC